MNTECLTVILEYVKESVPFITAGCTIYGVWLARSGLATWRKQLQSSARYDLAKKILSTISESSSIINKLNKEINFSFYREQSSNKFEKYYTEHDVEKLSSIQHEIEVLKEESLLIFESNIFDGIDIFISKYIDSIRILSLFYKNYSNLNEEIKINIRTNLDKYVPLVPKEEYLALKFMLDPPDFHDDHANLIDKVKLNISSYLRHISQ